MSEIYSKRKSEGYIKVSEGPAQVQLHTTSHGRLGVIQASEKPAPDAEAHFNVTGTGIEPFLEPLPTYVIALSGNDEQIRYSASDISG